MLIIDRLKNIGSALKGDTKKTRSNMMGYIVKGEVRKTTLDNYTKKKSSEVCTPSQWY